MLARRPAAQRPASGPALGRVPTLDGFAGSGTAECLPCRFVLLVSRSRSASRPHAGSTVPNAVHDPQGCPRADRRADRRPLRPLDDPVFRRDAPRPIDWPRPSRGSCGDDGAARGPPRADDEAWVWDLVVERATTTPMAGPRSTSPAVSSASASSSERSGLRLRCSTGGSVWARQVCLAAPDLDRIARADHGAVPGRCGAGTAAADLHKRGAVGGRIRQEICARPSPWFRARGGGSTTKHAGGAWACRRSRAIAAFPESDTGVLDAARPGDGEHRWVFFTSGTTGIPRAPATPTRRSLPGPAASSTARAAPATDRYPIIFPFTHVGGIGTLFAQLMTGASAVLDEAFDRERTIPALAGSGVTIGAGGTPIVQLYLEHQRRTRPRRCSPGCGSASPAAPQAAHDARRREGRARGPRVPVGVRHDRGALHHHQRPRRPRRCARHHRGTSHRRRASAGDRARRPLVWRPARRASCGSRAPVCSATSTQTSTPTRSTTRACSGPATSARLDDAGNVIDHRPGQGDHHPQGREHLRAEVEHVLLAHPTVADVAVLGLPDPDTGERCCAVVVPATGAALTLADLERSPGLRGSRRTRCRAARAGRLAAAQRRRKGRQARAPRSRAPVRTHDRGVPRRGTHLARRAPRRRVRPLAGPRRHRARRPPARGAARVGARAGRRRLGGARLSRRTSADGPATLDEQVAFHEELAASRAPGAARQRRRDAARPDAARVRHARAAGAVRPRHRARRRSTGARATANPTPVPTSRASAPAQTSTATSGCSTGQKVWCTLAHVAEWCFVLARTDAGSRRATTG